MSGCDLATIRVARRMLCRSGMADDKVNGEMSGYVTRAELREELEVRDKRFDRIDQRFDGVDQRLDGVDQRLDGIDRRLDGIDRRFDDFEQRMIHSMGQMAITIGEEVGRQIRASNEELRIELGQQIRASEERTRDLVLGLQDPYRDLPERVARLEEHTGLKR